MTTPLKYIFLTILIIPLFLKANVNDIHIQKKKSTFSKWSKKFKFVEGEVYLNKDTHSVEIMEFMSLEKKNYFLFCVVKYDLDSIVFLTSKDIEGFNVKGEYYQRNSLMDKSFFMHKVCSGDVNLFVKGEIPSDKRYLFFMNKNHEYVYYILNPLENNITHLAIRESGFGNTVVDFETKLLGESFKKFINMEMGECAEVRNMVRAEYYKMEDFKYIVDTYNSCFKNVKNIK